MLYALHVKDLKEKLKGYSINPFSYEVPKCLSTGEVIKEEVYRDMLYADNIGESKMNDFMKQCLITGTTEFFEPLTKNKLNTGIKKIKTTRDKITTALKEDCQAFGLIVDKAVSLKDPFRFPITLVPLPIASPDSKLRQSEKASFRNYLIKEADAKQNEIPVNASWFIDGLAVIRSLKPKKTYKEWITSLIKYITTERHVFPQIIAMVNDTYIPDSVKNLTRIERGLSATNVIVQGVEQNMPQGNKWQELLHSNNFKQQIIELIKDYILKERSSILQLQNISFIITAKNKVYKITNDITENLPDCNHEEADTQLVLRASQSNTDVVIVSTDTDVLILMIWAFAHSEIKNKWYLKYDYDKFADIGKIVDYLGKTVSLAILNIHALTGCDTTSYFYRVGKIKVLKKVLQNEKFCLFLSNLGIEKVLSERTIENIEEFIKTVLYSGMGNETYIETRIRLYKSLKQKSSLSIPPDPDSVVQAIKRVHYQTKK